MAEGRRESLAGANVYRDLDGASLRTQNGGNDWADGVRINKKRISGFVLKGEKNAGGLWWLRWWR